MGDDHVTRHQARLGCLLEHLIARSAQLRERSGGLVVLDLGIDSTDASRHRPRLGRVRVTHVGAFDYRDGMGCSAMNIRAAA